jgi:DnaJ-class molecular chaperone
MQPKNFYDLLDIPADSPQNMIVPAFRARIKQVHPDKFHAQGEAAENK